VTVALVLGIGLIGGLGALARFVLDGAVSARVAGDFPWGTLAVNLSGAFLLGLLVGMALSDSAFKLLGVGLLGGLTTFSTWVFESHRLSEDGQLRLGLVNFVLSLVLGVAAAWLGRKLGAAL
jgi:CrcB protein